MEKCESPQRLLVVTKHANASDEQVIETMLTAEGNQTILVWEEREGYLRTSSPPTEPGCRFMSKILLPTWPATSAATPRPGSTNSSLLIESWPPKSASAAR